mmetsp:Transcript_8061/g.15182  ORF Transcript_8061/g.15182 Transcript_8061/m.15182 type:complete len:415 (-) Transcript_8061:4-1248(-)
MQDITDTVEGFSSYDLSEASSDNISTGSQDTDRHSNVTIATTSSRNHNCNISRTKEETMHASLMNDLTYQQEQEDFVIQEEKDVYPNFMFSMGGGVMGDPLPVVKEGKVLKDEMGQEEEEEEGFVGDYGIAVMNSSQVEEQEFTREMNTTKIAFSAYRNAVLHLIHHQPSRKSGAVFSPTARGNGEEKSTGENGEQSGVAFDDTEEEDANHRMTLLEEMAKRMVETKAKSCFEAVEVANEFMERRMERRRGTNALFQELLCVNIDRPRRSVKKEEACVEKRNNKAVETRHAGMKGTEKRTVDGNKITTIVSQPCEDFVPIRRTIKHPQCILATLPPFQFQKTRSNNNQQHQSREKDCVNDDNDDDKSSPASYGTTSWISDMIKWRRQRQIHNIYCLEKCGCPDCSTRLKEIQSQ